MGERIRVLVVATDPRLTRLLTRALPARGPVVVLGPVADVEEAANSLAVGLADLAVVDLDRADGSGIDVLAAVAAAGGRGRVLAAADVDGPEVAANALSAGACGLLPRIGDHSLLDAFRRALAGELVLPADDLSSLVDRITATDAGNRGGAEGIRSLTPREREILQTLAAGASTVEVAEAFGISPLTVQSHVKNILAKLGVHSKVDAVRIAWRHGVASPSRPSVRAG
jgi:DNA-binding NarL/FixJ family response regulator